MVNISFALIDNDLSLRNLELDWMALSDEASAPFYVSYPYCSGTWLQIQKPLGRELFCIVGTIKGQLMLVWPFVRYRNKKLWIMLRALTSHAAEYSDILISPRLESNDALQQVWRFLREQSGAHIVNLPFVLADSKLHNIINNVRFHGIEQDMAPYLEHNPTETWDMYYSSLGGNHRRSMIRRRKVLAMNGKVDYRIAETDDEIKAYITWLIENKREWVKIKGKADASLDTEDFENFLIGLAIGFKTRHLIKVFGLLLNGIPVSVKIIVIGKTQVNRIIAAYDTGYAKASPGMLLDEYVMKWIFDHNYSCNFGVGGETSKLVWSRNNLKSVASYQIPINQWGKMAFRVWKYARDRKNKREKNVKGD